ncbi:MAG: ABC transporter permease subunit [Dethiosulfatibacter sp.]|nr:ABC transporter permease subunit [Dethiosulfatibacter sp.]
MGWLKWKVIPPLLFLLFVLGAWQIVVTAAHVSPIRPWRFEQEWEEAIEEPELIWMHNLTTILETTVGFAFAVVLSLITAGAMVLSPWIKRLLYPFLIISQTVPLIAVAPLLILWLGYGLLPKIIIVIIVCYFPITMSFYRIFYHIL